jgi:hypothetical protein
VIDVINYSGGTLRYPDVEMDIDGTLYCVCEDITNDVLVYAKSEDHGLTWTYIGDLYDHGAADYRNPILNLLDGHIMVCTVCDFGGGDIEFVRRGMWELESSANPVPCAVSAIAHALTCDVQLYWHGGEGIDGDIWSFQAAYEYAMKNIISGTPQVPYRSTQDEIGVAILIDMGVNYRLLVDAIAVFGANVRTLGLMMNSSLVWDSTTPIDETISFDLVTITLDALTGRFLRDTSVLSGYSDHELAGFYVRSTSGSDTIGTTWKILDNVGDWIELDTVDPTGLGASDTLVIFSPKKVHTFTNTTPYRYIRLEITAQETAEGYYQLGEIVLGKAITLARGWSATYGLNTILGRSVLRTPLGFVQATQFHDPYKVFDLTWNAAGDDYPDMDHLLRYIGAGNIVIVPDHAAPLDAYLTICTTPVSSKRVYVDEQSLKLKFEEVL